MGQTTADDPRCPECGEPIGATATYCMHCSTDLTEERDRADADHDGYWNAADADDGTPAGETSLAGGRLLDPDGIVDNSLTAAVGVAGGLVVGAVGTLVVLLLTGSEWGAWIGLLAWLGATAHLVRRPTVQDAIARTAYGVAIVLLLVPLIAFGPSNEGTDLATRGILFVMMLGGVAIPAALAAGVGFAISRFFVEPGAEE